MPGSHSVRATLASRQAWVSGIKLVLPGVFDPAMTRAREEFFSLMLGVLPARLVSDRMIAVGGVIRETSGAALDCVSVELVDLGVRAVCFDSRSGLPAEVRKQNREVIRFSDYRAVDGVRLPREVRYLYNGSVGRAYEAISYVVNPALTPAMFRHDGVD
jgi:hypothetical protein